MSIVAQNNNTEKVFSNKSEAFFSKYKIFQVLLASQLCKEKGIPVLSIIKYLFTLVFENKSMYMSLLMDKAKAGFSKDSVYRLQNSIRADWQKFTGMIASRIINDTLEPVSDEKHIKAFVIDDSSYERGRSKNVELLANHYDHAHHRYTPGFRLLTLGWTDGITFLPVNSCLLSTENKDNRINEAKQVEENTNGYKRRIQAQKKATEVVIELLQMAKEVGVHAKYVLFDSWFSFPQEVIALKELGYHVIAMVKKTPKVYYGYNGEKLSVTEIYKRNKKRRGRSKYLLSVTVDVYKDDMVTKAKLVYVRNRNKKKDYLVILCTDTSLSEEEIIRTYGLRWSIEVFFKTCKSLLRLTSECRSISYDAMCSHIAIVFLRYMFLALEVRNDQDQRTMGPLFYLIQEELQAASYAEVFESIQELFSSFAESFKLPEDTVSKIYMAFCALLPVEIAQMLNINVV